jgi:hypothetical protein
MSVDFFAKPCNNFQGNCQTELVQCLQAIPNNTFGISDVDGANNIPAKVNVVNPDPATDFIVVNGSNTQVTFKAVDWCVPIYRTGSYSLDDENRIDSQFSSDSDISSSDDLIKRCEGFLQYDNSIVFVEIKNRPDGRGWLKDSREKFEETILSFREHHPNLATQIKKPILCNPSFPGPHQNETIQKKILKEKIGLEFIRKDNITI